MQRYGLAHITLILDEEITISYFKITSRTQINNHTNT